MSRVHVLKCRPAEHSHTERARDHGDCFPDCPIADNPDGESIQFNDGVTRIAEIFGMRPMAILHARRVGADVIC